MSGIFACLLKKEWLDAIRDKRAFTAAMMIAFLGPAMFGASIMMSLQQMQKQEEINISLQGAEQFPSLITGLEHKGIFTDKKGAEDSKLTVIVAEDFSESINKGEPAEIIIKGDFSNRNTQRRVGNIKEVIRSFTAELAGMRLMARGISPSVVNPIKLVEQDTSTSQSRAGLLLGMLSAFVMMSVFVASTNVAIDCSAGERERNSLEFLLAQPVQPLTLVIAKTLNTSFFSLVGGALTILMMGVVIGWLPMHKLGLQIDLNFMMGLVIWLVMLPLAAFAATFQLVTSFKSKTFKEAQSYINMTIILPMVVPMIITMSDVDHPALPWLPLTGQNAFIGDFVKGEAVDLAALAVSSGSTLALSAVFIWIMARGLKTEKMILGL